MEDEYVIRWKNKTRKRLLTHVAHEVSIEGTCAFHLDFVDFFNFGEHSVSHIKFFFKVIKYFLPIEKISIYIYLSKNVPMTLLDHIRG